ncbi:phosphoethanolamine transferase [uncultured Photobacterium sp.]|uniref:phosphoethanolamine transferase n=1 Tax=uncultured Photobacterium sp. TaxID=173973 RepID=UPI0026133590|nr:phosphoethanolamine transferase [uncultured Photobacterium sp.]
MKKVAYKPILSIIFLLLFSISINHMLGYKFKIDRTLIMFFFSYLLIDNTYGRISLFGLSLISALYYPISWFYGHPNLTIMSAILETNIQESTEFLYDIPVIATLLSITYLLIIYILFFKLRIEISVNNKKTMSILFALSCLWQPLKSYASDKDDNYIYTLRFTPVEFISDFYKSYHSYSDENKKIRKQVNQPPNWDVLSSTQKYKNYILVIGESVRKDYLNSYGFELDNTPFMSNSPGIVWDGLIAPGPNTYTSVVRLLSVNNGIDVELNNNIISLANESGLNTYWLSNQGKVGPTDTVISSIAYYSKNIFFSKKGSYKDVDIPDSALLPHLSSILDKKTKSPKFIVIHLMGSHQNFCQRVDNDIKFDHVNRKISCYITSLYKTDDLLKNIRKIANKTGEEFSIVYVADHGLGHPNNKKKNLKHNPRVKQAYEVPLFITSSDDNKHTYIERKRSGLHFIHFLSEWIGVTAVQLEHGYNFYSQQSDMNIKVNTGDGKLVNFSTLQDDPV